MYNLELVILNLVTICNLWAILQMTQFNLMHKIIIFRDSFSETKSVKNQECFVSPSSGNSTT